MSQSSRNALLLVILALTHQISLQVDSNSVEDVDPLMEAASAILKEQNAKNLVGNLLQPDNMKQLGDMLGNANLGNVLENVASMVGGNNNALGQGFDPSLISGLLSMAAGAGGANSKNLDFGTLLSSAGWFMEQMGVKNNPLGTLQMITQTIAAFTGPEAGARELSHQEHAWFLPPFLEKLHILFDHFMHSDLSKILLFDLLGAEKMFKVFQDEKGDFSYQKFVDMLENQSFRRHWLKQVTSRVAAGVSFFADPTMYKKYLTTSQHLVNSVLQSQGYPKSTYFDPNRPTATISALIDYLAKKHIGVKISSKQYVKPLVEYFQSFMKKATQKTGLLGSTNSRALSDNLADTINLDIIEPIAKANRAFRFLNKVPKCDKYVLCLINHESPDAHSLNGLKPLLTQGTSLVMSWFLSSKTETPFLTYYGIITDETEKCKSLYKEECQDFHLEEQKVTTAYVHNEL